MISCDNKKKCSKCSKIKNIKDFSIKDKDKNRRSECRDCTRIYSHMKKYLLSKNEALLKINKLDKIEKLKKDNKKICKICNKTKSLSCFDTTFIKNEKYEFIYYKTFCKDCKYINSKMIRDKYRETNYFSYICHDIKTRAKRKKIPFNIDSKYLKKLFNKQEGFCKLTNIKMNFQRSNWSNRNPYMASVDRIIPNKGYTKGNIRWVIFAMNLAKGNWSDEIYYEIANGFINNYKK